MSEEDQPAVTIVSTEIQVTLQWCLRYLTEQDEAEAARELAIGLYRPLTVSVAQSLHSLMEYQGAYYWPPGVMDKVHQVLATLSFDSPPPMPPR